VSNGNFEIYTSESVTEFSGDLNGVKSVKTNSGREVEADFVVIASGVVPNTEIAKDAGIELGYKNAIKVNDRMRTNIENIYACGDCSEDHIMVSDTKSWIPLGSTANKEGRCAAINACGSDEVFKGVLGSTVTRCLNLTMSMTGLTVKEAVELGYQPEFAVVTKNDKVGFMPDVNNITLKLVGDKKTGLLLGCQAVGTGDADKRVNIVTSALVGKLTVRDFVNDDITYAPPYSPTIDPLLNAAQILASKIENTYTI
jgi:NADPH-dependent 2,4-dienoyl-CoA reductase/sulfur reductase-like enzyme